MDNCLGNGKPLALTAREGTGFHFESIFKFQLFNAPGDYPLVPLIGDSVRHCGISEALPGRQILIQTKEIGQITNRAVGCARIGKNVGPVHKNTSRHRFFQRRQAAQQGGLASAVGADQRGNAPFAYCKGNIVQSPCSGIIKYQVFNVYHRVSLGDLVCGSEAIVNRRNHHIRHRHIRHRRNRPSFPPHRRIHRNNRCRLTRRLSERES